MAIALVTLAPSARAQTPPPVVTPLTVTTTADHDDGACDANDCTLSGETAHHVEK